MSSYNVARITIFHFIRKTEDPKVRGSTTVSKVGNSEGFSRMSLPLHMPGVHRKEFFSGVP
jgi:hypothetical protein